LDTSPEAVIDQMSEERTRDETGRKKGEYDRGPREGMEERCSIAYIPI